MNWFSVIWQKLPKKLSTRAGVEWGTLLQNFTPRADRVIRLAEVYALSLNHPFVGTEHLLVGMIQLGDQGVAQGVLLRRGVQLQAVCDEIERMDGRGPNTPIKLMLPSPRLKRVFDLASEEAGRLENTYIGTEHLLLALLREGKEIGASALRHLNIDLDETIQEVQRKIDPAASC